MRAVLSILLLVSSIQLSCALDAEHVNGKLESTVIEAMEHNKLGSALLGVKVIDAGSGETVLAFNSDKNVMPASNTKLLTAAAALLSLGKDYRYKTTVYYDHKHQDEIHNLYIDFSGDPSLTSKDLSYLLAALQKQGIHSISGNVYLVNSVFQGRDYPINQSQSDSVFGYGVPSSAYNLNENQVILNLKTQEHAFNAQQITGETITYHNHLVAADNEMLKTCQFDASMDKSNTLSLAGCLPRGDYTFKFAIVNPKLMMKNVLRSKLTELGLKLKGDIQITTTTKDVDLEELTSHVSAKLSVLIEHMLQTSDNLYAQSFLRTMGDKLFHVGSIVSGKNALLKILQEDLALNTDNIQLEDGAGMSQNDLLNADFLTQLLYNMKLQKAFKVFVRGLPIYGQSGSLASRTEKALIGKVIAKTGTGTTSIALSGYLSAKNGKEYIFSILLGNLLESQRALASKLQDQILLALYQE